MRVLLADSRARTRFALRTLLGQTTGIEVAGEAADAASLLAQVEAISPHLLLLDWGLWDLAAADILPAMRSACPGLRVIALSGRPEDEPAVLAAGADAFVSKADPADRLLAAVHDCCRLQPGEKTGEAPCLSAASTTHPPVGIAADITTNPRTQAQATLAMK